MTKYITSVTFLVKVQEAPCNYRSFGISERSYINTVIYSLLEVVNDRFSATHQKAKKSIKIKYIITLCYIIDSVHLKIYCSLFISAQKIQTRLGIPLNYIV